MQFAYNIAGEQIKSKDQERAPSVCSSTTTGSMDDRVRRLYGNAIDNTFDDRVSHSIRTRHQASTTSEYLDLGDRRYFINTRNEIAYTFDSRACQQDSSCAAQRRIDDAVVPVRRQSTCRPVDWTRSCTPDDTGAAHGRAARLFRAFRRRFALAESRDSVARCSPPHRARRRTARCYLGLSRRADHRNRHFGGERRITGTGKTSSSIPGRAHGRYAPRPRFWPGRHGLWYAAQSWSPATQPPLTDIASRQVCERRLSRNGRPRWLARGVRPRWSPIA